jgi:hypothetical protein
MNGFPGNHLTYPSSLEIEKDETGRLHPFTKTNLTKPKLMKKNVLQI